MSPAQFNSETSISIYLKLQIKANYISVSHLFQLHLCNVWKQLDVSIIGAAKHFGSVCKCDTLAVNETKLN
jgi:hypothetical protein